MPKMPNQVSLSIGPKAPRASGVAMLQRGGEITWLNIHAANPGGKFSLNIKDPKGTSVCTREFKGNDTKRYGERLNLPLTDSQYTIEMQHLEGDGNTFQVFLE